MSKVLAHMTMSLDGYIATDADEVGALFDWYEAGTTEVETANPDVQFHLDEAGVEVIRSVMTGVGALVCGRRLFDITNGWGDRHPAGAPVVVVTHNPPDDRTQWPRTHFAADVTQAIELAQRIAEQRDVVIASADIVGQALDLGLLDEIAVSLVPLLMGGGKPYFGTMTRGPVTLDDPSVIVGTRATHLRYNVRR